MALIGRAPPRQRSRGVAALELALSLTFLVPLLMGTLDFGYYFYIGTNAEEAARAGVRAAVRASGGAACALTGAAVKAAGETPAVGSGAAGCIGGAAYCYMNEPPLSMGGAGSNTTVTLTCLTPTTVPPAPVNPTWRITVQVDFWPATTFCKWMMPASLTAGKVKYTASLTSD
jgi:Flp pilus assembly protein TadG